MARELPYLASYKNVEELFRRIQSAKQPEAFTTRFLAETMGLKSTGDRALITLLKALGFVDGSGRPTSEYATLKNQQQAPRALGQAIRRAYEPLFSANENAHTLSAPDLRGLVAQVAGSDAGMTTKICGTLNALLKLADMNSSAGKDPSSAASEKEQEDETLSEDKPREERHHFGALRPEFHYNVQVHLPLNASEETYLSIFNALRKAFS